MRQYLNSTNEIMSCWVGTGSQSQRSAAASKAKCTCHYPSS
uniref:Uncharacterized protein n=1 Tax=Klebsiella pneumoniae TaxID=573 RepID=A0A7S5L2Q3_KLEPN|nr:hypothetical protein pKpnB199_00105 [Klebsiella pneumoniae]